MTPPLANSEKAEECGEHCGSLMFPVVPLNPYKSTQKTL